jgi:glycerol-3-phosphate dehydrogenase
MAYGMKIVNNNNEPPKELVEGLNAIHATIALSEKLDIELPIMTSIKKILNREAKIDEIIKKLLSRPIKNEFN